MEMQKTYNPKDFEDRIYTEWCEKGYFHAETDPSKVPFTIVMPPPNITGQLHMGHAMDCTLQDTIIRFKRMQGYSALWLPGTDHAAIATEVKVVDYVRETEGKTKEDLGREEFLKRTWAWKDKYAGRICDQLKKMGSSCDWDRLAFTMDDKCSKAVREAFVNLYHKGLIYQGSRIINWCPHCKTALSDAEVEYSDEASAFWHLRYFMKDDPSRSLVVATTRPETMFGDTAVAVNPEDPRYRDMIGKTLVLPIVGREIPVVGDEHADMEFGTGCVKITPAHDPNDFEVGIRHQLPIVRVMNDDGTMNEEAGKFVGMDRYECRKAVVKELETLGNLVRIEPHTHAVGHCYRCHNAVEPIVSKQWFVKMEPLAKPAIQAVMKNKIKIIPDRLTKTYYNWMENIRDWCISRQLWWGHRIPVWYCPDCGEIVCEKEDPTVCPKCGGTHLHQDEDVLDTWFSSALWPFSTLGWPDHTPDLDYFYPTDVLVTGYDILFFWVSRMIFSGLEHKKQVPFRDVLFHGLVRDEQGRKMSKSLGNGVDPLVVIDQYGADSLRFSLMTGVAPGNDTRYTEGKVEAGRNFINKIWNASRFVIMNAEGKQVLPVQEVRFSAADKWIVSKLETCIKEVTLNLNKFELGVALSKLYDFMWDDFCDWYIELTKPALYGEDENKKNGAISVLCFVLGEALKLLHPFLPFVTEEIYQHLPHTNGSIMIADYPRYNAKYAYKKEAKAFEGIKEMIQAVRAAKTEVGCAPSKRVDLYLITENKRYIHANEASICKLAGANAVKYVEDVSSLGKVVSKVTEIAQIYIPLGELVDLEKEKARLQAELERVIGEIARADGKLNNQNFLLKAPKKLVEDERAKFEKYLDMKSKIEAQLKDLES